MQRAVTAAVEALGRPSVLVNCAGIGKFANAHDMAFEDWSRIIGVNLTGTFLMSQAVLPHLLDGRRQHRQHRLQCGAHGAAVQCRLLRLERRRRAAHPRAGRRVPAQRRAGELHRARRHGDAAAEIAFIRLPEGSDPTLLAKLRTPLGNAKPDEVAALVAFVASDEGRYMTGSIVSIDGGLTI